MVDMKKRGFAVVLVVLSSFLLSRGEAAVIRCTTVSQITAAVEGVRAGDEIVIAAGTYFAPTVPTSWLDDAQLTSQVAGTADNRIILRGEDPEDPPTISGSSVSFWSVIRLRGGADYWTIQDLILTNADKGIVVDGSDYVELRRLQIKVTGEEAVHIRDGSKHTLIEGCKISDTGRVFPGFGEAIYIGSDRGQHDFFASDVGNTTIRNCDIGPNVRGEPFDIREGTFETIIEYCTVDAKGLSGQNFADSFVDLKGTRTYVRFNEFYRNGETSVAKGIAVIDREVILSAFENVIHDNVFDFDDQTNIAIVQAGGRTVDTIAFDNQKIPAGGSQYSGSVTQSCCPDWYDRPERLPVEMPTEPPVALPTECFSGRTSVELASGEIIRMDKLKIGEKVLVQDGKYEEVYSFGHRQPSATAVFFEIATKSTTLEISGDHMVWVKKAYIPASAVRIGDILSNGETIDSIETVTRQGVYAPFTPSGTVLVNGLLCSSFVSMQLGSANLMIGSTTIPLSWQWLAHSFEIPHRTFSWLGETYTPDGVSNWVAMPRSLLLWTLDLPVVLQIAILLPVLLVLMTMALVVNSFLGIVTLVASYFILSSKFRSMNK